MEIGATTTGGRLELWVANSGQPISDKVKTTPFRPFFRGEVRSSQHGLYIASEIARVHGGKLSVNSDESETRFTLMMPL
ncbi:ATP-binding protein [Rhizobium sp. YAF28]|uniref:ATP-binding protein n=1 Tax=Rhizobium sp. YAF28 TaxID=3233081 RepID=UPI003F943F02